MRVCIGPIALTLDAHRTHVLVTVRDDSSAPASERDVALSEPSGRGLRIVSQLSIDWGQTSYRGGAKEVWAKVWVPVGSVLAERCEL